LFGIKKLLQKTAEPYGGRCKKSFQLVTPSHAGTVPLVPDKFKLYPILLIVLILSQTFDAVIELANVRALDDPGSSRVVRVI
jgi:hypothetical protein